MPATAKLWTVEEIQALPSDGNRYEIIGGELLVTPAPSWDHQHVALALGHTLLVYLREHRIGWPVVAPADVVYDRRTLVEPDVFVVPLVEGRRPHSWKEAGRLLLAVEVLSPSSAHADRIIKRRLYQRQEVPEYWIVDVEARAVERWRVDDERPEILSEKLEWQPDAALPALVIDLSGFFAEALGD